MTSVDVGDGVHQEVSRERGERVAANNASSEDKMFWFFDPILRNFIGGS